MVRGARLGILDRKYLGPARTAIKEMCKQKLDMLNCAGKADDVIAHWKSQGEPMPAPR